MAKGQGLEFRAAANAGNLREVKRLLEDKSAAVDINGCGPSGNRALHYAALKGHHLVVEYLVAQGADVDLKDSSIDQKTALEKASTPQTKMFLSMVRPLREAIAFAKALFPEEVVYTEGRTKSEQCKEFDSIQEDAKTASDKEYTVCFGGRESLYGQYIASHLPPDHASKNGPDEYLRQQDRMCEHMEYSDGMINLKNILIFAKERGFKQGRCGMRATAAFAYLVANNHTGYEIDNVLMGNKHSGHQFLMIGRGLGVDLKSAAGQYVLFCDPYLEGSFYSSSNIPCGTSVNLVKDTKYNNLKTATSTNEPSGEGFLIGRTFFEGVWKKNIDAVKELVSELSEKYFIGVEKPKEIGQVASSSHLFR